MHTQHKDIIIMNWQYRAIIGATIGFGVAGFVGGAFALAMDRIKLPMIRDYEIVMGGEYSNWQRNKMMSIAKEQCKAIETFGAVLSVSAVHYNLRDATPTEMAKGLGTAFLATKHACPKYRQFFEQDFADIVTNINGWDAKEVAEVLGTSPIKPSSEIH